ncbi:MAG: hypothetical protein HYX47_04190 [Burkholderiales bacterium]|nr:hypothetical protein [Burkholderiales bacterium]
MSARNTATPIATANKKTRRIQRELKVAGAELGLTSTALGRHLPPSVKHGDVAHALEQNAAIEVKVQEAADELAEVSELLDEEAAQRARLEGELALAQRAGPGK